MRQVAILSMDGLENFECYDHLTFPFFKQRGWQPVEVSWRDPDIDWNQFEVVVIRSPWDYQDDAEKFLAVLENIEQSSAKLENPITTVRWNIDKRYLAELENKGVAIVPTLWRQRWQDDDADWFEHFGCEELVIKPCISANADNTFRLKVKDLVAQKNDLAEKFSQRHFMVQPFMTHIVEEGEYSLFYFSGSLSHAILKTPAAGDFRVQEEHGGRLRRIDPEPGLIRSGDRALNAIGESLLYARLDFVRSGDSFLMMEAELIEPSLYFNMDPESAPRFVDAFVKRHP